MLDDLSIQFYEPYHQLVDTSRGIAWTRWCVGGKLNIVHNCLDKWIGTPAERKAAVRWEGEEGTTRVLTYGELHEEVARCANALRELGIGKGDRVALFMPMCPELVIAFFAVMKIGGIVLPLFSGYGSDAVVTRLKDAEAKALITADGFWRRGQQVHMKPIADHAIEDAPSVEHVIVVSRLGIDVPMRAPRDRTFGDLMTRGSLESTERTGAEDPLIGPACPGAAPTRAGPRPEKATMGRFLDACREVAGSGARIRWTSEEELAAHGVSADDLKAGRYGDAFVRLMAQQAARARQFYAAARAAFPAADARSLVPAEIMGRIYHALLREIEIRRPVPVLDRVIRRVAGVRGGGRRHRVLRVPRGQAEPPRRDGKTVHPPVSETEPLHDRRQVPHVRGGIVGDHTVPPDDAVQAVGPLPRVLQVVYVVAQPRQPDEVVDRLPADPSQRVLPGQVEDDEARRGIAAHEKHEPPTLVTVERQFGRAGFRARGGLGMVVQLSRAPLPIESSAGLRYSSRIAPPFGDRPCVACLFCSSRSASWF